MKTNFSKKMRIEPLKSIHEGNLIVQNLWERSWNEGMVVL